MYEIYTVTHAYLYSAASQSQHGTLHELIIMITKVTYFIL